VLVDGELRVWDTLAIAETMAERHPHLPLWPSDAIARARARSLCAEMHSGFTQLRNHCPMNIEASLPQVGGRVMEHAEVRTELQRVVQLWQRELAASGGPFLFGPFGITDAYYAPVLSRLRTYALPLPADIVAYSGRVFATEAVTAWVHDALLEHDSSPRTSRIAVLVESQAWASSDDSFYSRFCSFRLRCHFDRREKSCLARNESNHQPISKRPLIAARLPAFYGRE